MGTWFWYHRKAKNALNLEMATNSAAYCKIFSIVPRREKMRKKIVFPSFLAFCGPINYCFCIFKAIYRFIEDRALES